MNKKRNITLILAAVLLMVGIGAFFIIKWEKMPTPEEMMTHSRKQETHYHR